MLRDDIFSQDSFRTESYRCLVIILCALFDVLFAHIPIFPNIKKRLKIMVIRFLFLTYYVIHGIMYSIVLSE